MAKLYIVKQSDDSLSIVRIVGDDLDGLKLTKTLFEHSRTTDRNGHFDPAVHTREVIAAGISGHRALSLTGEIDDADLPTDRTFRDAWEWVD